MQAKGSPDFDQLYLLVESQKGFFTASQAKEFGYSQQLQSYYVTTGEWLRKARGIFKLRHFPAPFLQDDLYATYLWSCNRKGTPEGVFSHGTALYLHEVSTYSPPMIDLSVPKGFRRYSKPPFGKVALFHRHLDTVDCESIQGLKVTKLLKTIVDLLESPVIDKDYVLEALKTGLARLLITHSQLKTIKLSPAQEQLLLDALRRIGYDRIDEIQQS
jgi:hypothetical protein